MFCTALFIFILLSTHGRWSLYFGWFVATLSTYVPAWETPWKKVNQPRCETTWPSLNLPPNLHHIIIANTCHKKFFNTPTGIPVQPRGSSQRDQGPGGLCAAGQGRPHANLPPGIPAKCPGTLFNTVVIFLCIQHFSSVIWYCYINLKVQTFF